MATVVRQVDLGLKGRDVAATLGHQAVQHSHEGAMGSGILAGACSALVKETLSLTGSLPAGVGSVRIEEQLKKLGRMEGASGRQRGPVVAGGVLFVDGAVVEQGRH